ncbi:tetratricopeptide repeat protein [Nitrosomonas marina]|uniref:Tetratricopeptide repeat-containing protein n=1 Tax=Nitrosomonas marina TaxID=917 RepID=A0A1H8D709_9PROT|nr:tetratricopeptide repeat protein [Nitrosomonas marina]SEN02915.1 Tetratricopeptide repeat-containing protein [Nitrosomonas marina]
MTQLRNLFSCCVLSLVISSGHSETTGGGVTQTASNNSDGGLHIDSSHVRIELTLQQYEAGLKRLEKEAETRYVNALANNQQHSEAEAQLHVIQTRLQNIEQSYRSHIEDLRNRIEQLESVRGQISGQLLNRVQQALAGGDRRQAAQWLYQIEVQSAGVNRVTAETNYQRCQIAKDAMRYPQALTLCQRAAHLAPDRADYLSELAGLAQTLGDYEQAAGYYEQALTSYLKTHGEDHPVVAVSRNNLGTIWDALGEYKKAIGYYEQALASDIKAHGEHHPDVAIDRNNLGMAWYALGEYRKAIVYLEQALASDIRTYGKDHLQIATYHNNLAGAWHALGDYENSHDHLEQALKIFEKILGENHPNTSGVRANYQQLQSDMQDLDDESGSGSGSSE